jgi:hypothetical protein
MSITLTVRLAEEFANDEEGQGEGPSWEKGSSSSQHK